VRLAKTIAAFRANRRVAGTIKWARGFYAASLHKAVLRTVDGYIAGQHERHPDRIPRPGRRRGGPSWPRATARGPWRTGSRGRHKVMRACHI